MEDTRKPAHECTVEELDRELVIRGAQCPGEIPFRSGVWDNIPGGEKMMAQVKQMYEKAKTLTPNKELRHLDIEELAGLVMYKTMEAAPEEVRGRWDEDNRMDLRLVTDPKILYNAGSVAAICDADGLIDAGDGKSMLEVMDYGRCLSLNENEPFWHQPTAVGILGTGFLVKEDIMATASHCLDSIPLTQLRFVFGFRMLDSQFAATLVPNQKIFRGVEVINRDYKRLGNKSDWALVKLDRKAFGQPVVKLSDRELKPGEPVYVLGHPMGLPLKYSPGAKICGTGEAYFSADLDVYSRNSGSPVFCGKTHQVVGILVRGDCQDMRWTGRDWISVIYPNSEFESREPQCTKAGEFMQYCR